MRVNEGRVPPVTLYELTGGDAFRYVDRNNELSYGLYIKLDKPCPMPTNPGMSYDCLNPRTGELTRVGEDQLVVKVDAEIRTDERQIAKRG